MHDNQRLQFYFPPYLVLEHGQLEQKHVPKASRQQEECAQFGNTHTHAPSLLTAPIITIKTVAAVASTLSLA